MDLNLATKLFQENRYSGLMICGFEWGDPAGDIGSDRDLSFFSDAEGFGRKAMYRLRLLEWFRAWGHPLQTSRAAAGAFEKSIVQTNWLPSEAKNTDGRNMHAECVAAWDNFEFHIRELRPRLLMFMSVSLLDTLASSDCLERARALFGPEQKRRDLQAPPGVTSGGRRHHVARQMFGTTEIVALPHPTPRFYPPETQYIAAFRDEIGGALNRYKRFRGFPVVNCRDDGAGGDDSGR